MEEDIIEWGAFEHRRVRVQENIAQLKSDLKINDQMLFFNKTMLLPSLQRQTMSGFLSPDLNRIDNLVSHSTQTNWETFFNYS